jgi:hypothetical protein
MGVYQRKNGWAYEIRSRVDGKQITLASTGSRTRTLQPLHGSRPKKL